MEEVFKQLICLFTFTLTGIVIGILFDFFRILRKSFKTSDLVTYIQDFIFWIMAGAIILYSIFKFNNGEIRSYIFLGLIAGILLYMMTISRFIIKYTVIVIKFCKKIISYPIHVILNFLQKFLIDPIHRKIDKKTQKSTKDNKNLIKNQ